MTIIKITGLRGLVPACKNQRQGAVIRAPERRGVYG